MPDAADEEGTGAPGHPSPGGLDEQDLGAAPTDVPLATVLVPGVYTIALDLNDAAEGVHVAAPSIPLVVVAPAPAPAPTDRRTAQSGLTDFDQGVPGVGSRAFRPG